MYISEEVLAWDYYSENGSGLSTDEEDALVWRAHEIWRHAASLVGEGCSEFARSDSISNLKRAVNHRLQSLSQAYSFESLPFSSRKQTLEKFQFYGIIRPALLKEIFEVRNAIEHQDGTPPNEGDCRRYADFVWYFLKSTDSLLLMRPDDVHFWTDEEKCSLIFQPTFDGTWNITVQGEIPKRYILESHQAGAIELDESCERPSYIRSPIYGKWIPTPEQLTGFARRYFGLSGYWWEDHA